MTEPLTPSSQYATAKMFFDRTSAASPNLSASPEDQMRIRSYMLYEDFYYNRPETFKVFLRGEDQDPIYVPTAKKIVEAMNRFLCKNFNFVVPPKGNDSAENELILRMGNLFKREKLMSKFANQKRMGLVRGDAMFFVTADPNKAQFSRISIHELDPGNYFPINDPADKNRVIGCHIVEIVPDPREKEDRTKTVTRRRTYLKAGVSYNAATGQYEQQDTSAEGVWTEVTHWTVGKWDDRNLKASDMERASGPEFANMDLPMTQLPAQITSLPIYHWKNVSISGSNFGVSELSGIETLIGAINQGMSDTQLTMVMQGLGVYMTDAKPPQNESGETTGWDLGPGGVVEVSDGRTFTRVSGVGSVSPALELIQEEKNNAQEGSGIPDIAAGKVDVSVAESGISLSLQLAPILASSSEKELEILGTMDHMLYDLKTQWFPGYEGVTFDESVEIVSKVDDPMPVNREARIQEVLLLFTSQLITIADAQAELTKFGYKFTGTPEQILKDAAALAKASQGEDNRYAQETTPDDRSLRSDAGQLPPGFGAPTGATGPAGGSIPQTMTV